MITIENECVGCPPEKGCLGSVCPNRNVQHFYCDKCGEEVDTLYKYGCDEYCDDCVIEAVFNELVEIKKGDRW